MYIYDLVPLQELEISRNSNYQLTKKVEEQSEQSNDLQGVIMQFRSYVNQLQVYIIYIPTVIYIPYSNQYIYQ